jgi:hypothetical protein
MHFDVLGRAEDGAAEIVSRIGTRNAGGMVAYRTVRIDYRVDTGDPRRIDTSVAW